MVTNKEKKAKERRDFPKITVDFAIQYTKKISSKAQGDIVTYDKIGRTIGKSGGNLARIVSALNDFGLIEKTGRPKEWKITELGHKIVSKDSQADKLAAFLNPSINKMIWEEYSQTRPSNDSLMNYLKKNGFGDKPSKKLAKLYLKSYDQFSMKSPLTITSKDKIENEEESNDKASSSKAYLAYLTASIFPVHSENIEKDLNEIIKLADEEDMPKLATLAGFLKTTIAGKQKDEIEKELQKHAKQAKDIIKEELGIN